MLVSLIVAMDQNRGIGHKGQVPWRLSSDLRRFKTLTWGHHIIMGRKTHEAIGRALPGRVNLVISRNSLYEAPGCNILSSLGTALDIACQAGESEAYIIGGAQIYLEALPLAQRLYLTQVHISLPADVFFPMINFGEWNTIFLEEYPVSDYDQYTYSYSVMERNR